jgi:hypothetical protein
LAEHDSDREGREPDEHGRPFDEDAAWRAIVAGYGDEPPDPPGSKPFRSIEDLALLEKDPEPEPEPESESEPESVPKPAPASRCPPRPARRSGGCDRP